jgi:hypothetical protein
VAKYADIKAYTVANATLSAELAEGKPASKEFDVGKIFVVL